MQTTKCLKLHLIETKKQKIFLIMKIAYETEDY